MDTDADRREKMPKWRTTEFKVYDIETANQNSWQTRPGCAYVYRS